MCNCVKINVLMPEPGWSSTSGSLPLTNVSSEGEDSGGEASGSSTRSFAEPQTLLSQLSGRSLDFVLENCCVSINSASIIGYLWSIMIHFAEHNSDMI